VFTFGKFSEAGKPEAGPVAAAANIVITDPEIVDVWTALEESVDPIRNEVDDDCETEEEDCKVVIDEDVLEDDRTGFSLYGKT
jgi:hypothetical protein